MKQGIHSEIQRKRVSERMSGRSGGIGASLTSCKIPSAFLRSLGNLLRPQLCPHLDLVHVSPRDSQRFISFGVRCPLRKSVVSLERSGLTTDLASSGPPQLLTIWVKHGYTQMGEILQEMFEISNKHTHRKRAEVKEREVSGSDPLESLCLPTGT